MRCPTFAELPPPPPSKTGWPWTEESEQLRDLVPDGSPWPRVSIVTPSYNQAQFIEETIRSVLLQGYPNLEYIIIDGGSTDGSVEIIRKYEPWLAYWVSEKDDGQSDAINKGWALSTGSLIAWLNSDDCYLSGSIAKAVDFLWKHPNAALLYGDCEVFDVTSTTTDVFVGQVSSSLLETTIYQPSSLYRRDCLDKAGWLDTNLHYVMDTDWWWRINIHLEAIYFPSKLARYRRWKGAKTIGIDPQRYFAELWNVVERFFDDYLPENHRWQEKRCDVFYRMHLSATRACFDTEQWEAGAAHFQQALEWNSELIKQDMDRVLESLLFLAYGDPNRTHAESKAILDDAYSRLERITSKTNPTQARLINRKHQIALSKLQILEASDARASYPLWGLAGETKAILFNDANWLLKQRGRVLRALTR